MVYGSWRVLKEWDLADTSTQNIANNLTTSVGAGEVSVVDLVGVNILPTVFHLLPEETAKNYRVIIFDKVAGADGRMNLSLACENSDSPAIKGLAEFLESQNNVTIKLFTATKEGIDEQLKKYVEERVADSVKPHISTRVMPDAEGLRRMHSGVASNMLDSSTSRLGGSAQNDKPDQSAGRVDKEGLPRSAGLAMTDAEDDKLTESSRRVSTQDRAITADTQPKISRVKTSKLPEPTHNLRSGHKDIKSLEDLKAVIAIGDVPNMVASLLGYAFEHKATDVHIEPMKESVRFRMRVDGNLMNITEVPKFFRAAIISRIKELANMKTDEQRVPQDGTFVASAHGKEVDIRVATLPTMNGEKIELKFVDKSAEMLTLEQTGIDGHNLEVLEKAIGRPYGTVLITGPSGSGKTTTLYSILNRLVKPDVNIVTLEDPVEMEIPGINQSQIIPDVGYSFADGLRATLRQDPDIIMIGEIADAETAAMCTHAALTGHLLLSTLYTNDAAETLTRWINLGVEPYLIAVSINAVVAQRLVRKLCPLCRVEDEIAEDIISEIRGELAEIDGYKVDNTTHLQFYKPVGCKECKEGYIGRTGIFEVLAMSDAIEKLVVDKQPKEVIAVQAKMEGMITLRQDGILKALQGITSIGEVWRLTKEAK